MGKVTVVVHTHNLTSSELEALVHELLYDADFSGKIPGHPVTVLVVPDDEDYPEL